MVQVQEVEKVKCRFPNGLSMSREAAVDVWYESNCMAIRKLTGAYAVLWSAP